jgi:glycosyltransferase involved in cell wall biosynthesis
MRICYLLESTELCGGVRVVFDQARALAQRGHQVSVRALRGKHEWYPYPLGVDYVSRLDQRFPAGEGPDVTVGTFWTTVAPAVALGAPLTVHLCQGFEGALPEYDHVRHTIENAYRIPIPKITVGEWLVDRLKIEFGTETFPVFCVGQVVDTELFRPGTLLLRRLRGFFRPSYRILLIGLYESSCKAVADALHAVSIMRRQGEALRLIRVSTGHPSTEEISITQIDEYHTMISPREMSVLYRRAHLLLAPSLAGEGFGLPFAEALASGLPAVATAIPSHLSFSKRKDYACFVPEGDPEAMAAAARRILHDHALYRRLQEQGLSIVRSRFGAAEVSQRLEALFSKLMPNE